MKDDVMGSAERQPRRPDGWRPPGPSPVGSQGRSELVPAHDEDLSYLCGDWRLFQKRRGHRWSVDDLVTAWLATRVSTSAASALDLGCGLGSVLLLLAFRMPSTTFVGLEAQNDRAAMARRSIAYNGVDDRCQIVDGDLRSQQFPNQFDLVTGTPPYFPSGSGPESEHPHAAACRFEHRGGVEAYLSAAKAALLPDGVFVMCSAAIERDRVTLASRRLGWHLSESIEVIPRQGKAPLFVVDAFRLTSVPLHQTTLTVRDHLGQWTPTFAAVRESMGLPVSGPHHSSKTTK